MTKPNKFLILGNGYIGKRLQEVLRCPIADGRIRHYADVQSAIEQYRPKILINCIGFTGENNVDDCEEDIDRTLEANTFLPIMMAEAAFRNKIKFVHISSGCVFHYDYKKQKPIQENFLPDFHDLLYSRTKIYAEGALESLVRKRDVLILRIRVPLDNRKNRRNLFDKLIRYGRVIDAPNSVTYIPDFLKAFQHLIRVNATGVFHVVNKTPLYYPDLLEAYKKYVPDYAYEVIPLKNLKLTRTNVVLSTNKLERTGFKVRSIKEVLEECVKAWIKS
jgi:dTDP-4-dehydrorhamnose reductase